MSITENNIKSIRFFNNNIKKLDNEINKTIIILEELHEKLYGIYIKLDKDKYLNIILTKYKEIIYNKIIDNNDNKIPDYDFYYKELHKLITECHFDTYNEKINWYYKSQFSLIFSKLRNEKEEINNINNINIINEKLIKDVHQNIDHKINLKLENFEDNINYNINYNINKKINDFKNDFDLQIKIIKHFKNEQNIISNYLLIISIIINVIILIF